MLIDCSYFTKGSRHILNATLGNGKFPNANAIEVCAAIEAYIAEYQEKYLVNTLGASIGNKVHNYLICLEEDEEPKHNANFDTVCARLRESFADFVFFYILRDSASQATMTGLVRLKCANEYVSPIIRQVNIWNAMVDKHRLFSEWIHSAECPLSGIGISKFMLTKINRFNL